MIEIKSTYSCSAQVYGRFYSRQLGSHDGNWQTNGWPSLEQLEARCRNARELHEISAGNFSDVLVIYFPIVETQRVEIDGNIFTHTEPHDFFLGEPDYFDEARDAFFARMGPN